MQTTRKMPSSCFRFVPTRHISLFFCLLQSCVALTPYSTSDERVVFENHLETPANHEDITDDAAASLKTILPYIIEQLMRDIPGTLPYSDPSDIDTFNDIFKLMNQHQENVKLLGNDDNISEVDRIRQIQTAQNKVHSIPLYTRLLGIVMQESVNSPFSHLIGGERHKRMKGFLGLDPIDRVGSILDPATSSAGSGRHSKVAAARRRDKTTSSHQRPQSVSSAQTSSESNDVYVNDIAPKQQRTRSGVLGKDRRGPGGARAGGQVVSIEDIAELLRMIRQRRGRGGGI